jgi:small subunit ribosomal protein S4e
MARGIIKHLKRSFAPSHWMLGKLNGRWAPKPSAGPHRLRECLPLIVMLRNRLKYALTYRECKMIVMQRLIKVDHQVRTDHLYPCGFQDVITIEKTGENFRLLYDVKGRFVVHPIDAEEAKFKLCKVKSKKVGDKGIPIVTTNDGRTFRYPDPLISVGDTVKVNLTQQPAKIVDFVKFNVGNLVACSGGKNCGRIGVVASLEKHNGSFNIVHVKDAAGHVFATRQSNIFVIGKGSVSLVTLPKGKGVKKTIIEEMASKA